MQSNEPMKWQYQRRKLSYLLAALAIGLAVTMAVVFTARSLAANDPFGSSYVSASQSTLMFGEKLTYSIHLINNSTADANANVSDKVPVALSYVTGSVSNSGVYNAGIQLLTWDNVKVPGSSEVVLTFDVTPTSPVTQTTAVVNTASIQVIASDGLGQISNRAVSIDLVPGEPPKQVVNAFKSASQPTLAPGQTLTFTIQVINSGAEAATVDVTDPIPGDLAFIENSQSNNGTYDPNLMVISWRAVQVPATSEVDLTFDVKTALDVYTSDVKVTNVATVVYGTQELKPEATITIVPAPQREAVVRPTVSKVTIGDSDVISDPNVTLHITASADAKWMFIREYAPRLSQLGGMVWTPLGSSGWIPFDPNPSWKLANTSGVHYIGVVVASGEGAASMLTFDSIDFVSLNLANTTADKPGYIPYQVYYDAGVNVSITLTPSSGSADLYIWQWKTGPLGLPDWYSEQPGTAVDQVSFTTPAAGIYIILVDVDQPGVYNLTITPSGGPTAILAGMPVSTNTVTASTPQITSEPIFQYIGINPLGSAEAITGPYFIRLPIVNRN